MYMYILYMEWSLASNMRGSEMKSQQLSSLWPECLDLETISFTSCVTYLTQALVLYVTWNKNGIYFFWLNEFLSIKCLEQRLSYYKHSINVDCNDC